MSVRSFSLTEGSRVSTPSISPTGTTCPWITAVPTCRQHERYCQPARERSAGVSSETGWPAQATSARADSSDRLARTTSMSSDLLFLRTLQCLLADRRALLGPDEGFARGRLLDQFVHPLCQ